MLNGKNAITITVGNEVHIMCEEKNVVRLFAEYIIDNKEYDTLYNILKRHDEAVHEAYCKNNCSKSYSMND